MITVGKSSRHIWVNVTVSGEKLKHENEPIISPWKIDFRSTEDVQSQERSRILVKLHGG